MTVIAQTGVGFAASALLGPGLTTVGVQVINLASGGTALTRTTSGVVETGVPGVYRRPFAAFGTEGFYQLQWDDGAGSPTYAVEDLTVESSAASSGIIVGANPGVITLDGITVLTTFQIKRYDTLPIFEFKLRHADGSTPVFDTGTTAKLTARPQRDKPLFTGAPTIHSTVTNVNLGDAHFQYQFLESETADTAGVQDYYVEIETTRPDGSIETFPQTGYVAMHITPDLDPGVDP